MGTGYMQLRQYLYFNIYFFIKLHLNAGQRSLPKSPMLCIFGNFSPLLKPIETPRSNAFYLKTNIIILITSARCFPLELCPQVSTSQVSRSLKLFLSLSCHSQVAWTKLLYRITLPVVPCRWIFICFCIYVQN